MMKTNYRWLGMLLLFAAALPRMAFTESPDPIAELSDARRIYVPVEDLDVIVERDKKGVLLTRAKFDVLMTQAKANVEKNAVPSGIPVVVTSADYAARVEGDQLLLTVTAELTQFEDDWRESRFTLQRLAVEQALVDDVPALIGRHPDGTVSVFTDARGKHSLKLQLSTELSALGSDQVAAFSLLRAPSGSLSLTLPAGKRLLIGNLQLERPAPLDQVADYKIAVGGTSGIQLRITDRAAENAADSLSFATTGYGLNVAPGEVTWHALTSLQIFGKPVDRLSFSIPRTLEIADVDATGLEAWDLSDDPNDPQRTNISLTFGQAFDGGRKISLKGVMSVATGKPWAVPPLRIANVTSHIGQILVQYPAGLRLRVDETAGVRRATRELKPAADMPDDFSHLNATESLRFDVWQPDFILRLTTQPKQREVQSAVAVVLDVNATGLELQAAISVETHFAPLFELDIRLPAEWQVLSALRDNQPLKWQIASLDEVGINQLRILLDPPLASGASGQIRLALRRDVESWPVETEPITVSLPELYLPQSSLSEGVFVVRGDEDLDLVAYDTTGLDTQPLKAAFERMRFQSQDTRYSGKLRVTRKPSRIAAQTITFGRIDRQTFHTFIQSVVEVQGGGVRTIQLALPESAGTSIRFECPGPRIVEQKSAAPQNGERIWTLQFDQRLRGQALIACDIELPRGEAKEFVVPQCRFIDAERQNGYFAIEAGGEQRLTISAKDAAGTALPEVDPLELPNVFYQPKERIVAVYRAAATGAVLSLSEQLFEKLPIPTAICPLLQVSSILGRTGELQHQATFQLNAVGVQGLHVTLPTGSTLWATLVDGQPVEVRHSGDVYLVPLTSGIRLDRPVAQNSMPGSGIDASGLRTLQLFYRSEVAAVTKSGTLVQDPPSLTVESSQRTALPVEVLEQRWDLHYPDETRLIESHSPLEAEQPLDRISLLGTWTSRIRIPKLRDLGGQMLMVLAAIGIIAMLTYATRQEGGLITSFVLICVLGGATFALMLPAVQQARRAPNKGVISLSQPSSEERYDKLPSAYYLDDDVQYFPAPKFMKKTEERIHGLNDKPGAVGQGIARLKFHAEGDIEESKATIPRLGGDGIVGLKSHTVRNRTELELPELGGPLPRPRLEKLHDLPGPAAVAQNEPPADKPARDADMDEQGQPADPADRVRALGLLSLAIDFVPPAGSRTKTFHYVGADTSPTGIPLEVDYVDRHSGTTMRIFVTALVAMIGWFAHRARLSFQIGLATLGFVIPLALLPLVSTHWQPVLDGILFGTLAAILSWLICGLLRCCRNCCRRVEKLNGHAIAIMLLFVFALSQTAIAADKQQPPLPTLSTEPKPLTTLVVPFDAGTDPLASERVFLSHEQFLQLYHLANPDKVTRQPAPQSGGIFEALYAANLAVNESHPDESVVEVMARYAVKSFIDGQLIIELPVGKIVAREVKIDGQSAALIATPVGFKVAVSKPGLHTIDFAFNVPAKLSGTTGSFSLPLLPVPAGKFGFKLPEKDLSIRVNGSSTIFRRVNQDAEQFLEFPIDKGGDIAVAWQPQQAQGAANAVIHVDSVEAITLTDAGAAVSHGFGYRVRQGGISDTSFTLPNTLRLQAVNGPDVGGWELKGEGADRKLRVIFRRNVNDQTRLTIETFLEAKIAAESATIAVPQITPLEVTNEIGQVAVFAGNQFSIRAEQVDSLAQIDSDKFATQIPVSRPSVAPQLAYRFSKRPFTLNLRVNRQESQAHVTAQQAAFITLRKQQITTRLRYNLSGAPRSSLQVALPANFVLLDVQATGLRDYYISKEADKSILTVELKAPRLGMAEVVISGFVPRENTAAAISFPQPLEATRLESTAAVWLDEGFVGTLEAFAGWRSVDASQVGSELQSVRPSQTAQFAFASTSPLPGEISLNLSQSTPRLSANGLSMVTVTDVAVIYALALQWQIDAAKTDTLTLTTPNWLAGKLDFQGDGVREATHVNVDNDRTRWTISLRTPVSGKYFATATATLPPVTTEVLAPAIVFEYDQKPLASQRQYVLLINSSLAQLGSVDPSLVESVQRDDVPVVIQQDFIDQATELVRVKSLLTAPKWSLHTFAQQQGAPASVNVADLTTILSRDGTYRAQAIYTIKNRSRQFLALKMPEGTELLSVFVAGQPSRAVAAKLASLNGASAQMIALPKTSAASLSFPVKIVWRGHLKGPLPKSTGLSREEFAVPAPQILSQQDDPEFGIPVAGTRWTVYVPDDMDAQASRSTSKHNLSLSGRSDRDSLYGNATLQEADELIAYLEQTLESDRRVKSQNQLKKIGLAAGNAKLLGLQLDGFQDVHDGEFAKRKADVMKRLSKVEKLASDENRKTNDYFLQSKQGGMQPGLQTFEVEGLGEGEFIANQQQRAFITSNTSAVDGKSISSVVEFNFGLGIKESEEVAKSEKDDAKSKDKKALGKPVSGESRSQLRMTNDINLDALNATVTNNGITRNSFSGGGNNTVDTNGIYLGDNFKQSPDGNVNGQLFFLNSNGLFSEQINPDFDAGGAVQFSGRGKRGFQGGGLGGGMGGGSALGNTLGRNDNNRLPLAPFGSVQPPGSGPSSPSAPAAQKGSLLVRNINIAPNAGVPQGVDIAAKDRQLAEQFRGVNPTLATRQSAGLSLDINLPAFGHKLVFTKVGGDPKLALEIRLQQSVRWGIGLVWSAVWFFIGINVLITLRSASGLNRLLNQLPVAMSVLGILGFCILPSPLSLACFILFLLGAIMTAWNLRSPATAE